jgi:3D (Asp-Asp-Asp) domain-containing protein
MRVVGVIAVTALIAPVTAFGYEASELLLTGENSGLTTDEVLSKENAPFVSCLNADPSVLELTGVVEFAAAVDIMARPNDERIFVVELMGAVTATTGHAGATPGTVREFSAQT